MKPALRLLCALICCTSLRAQAPASITSNQDSTAPNPAAPAAPVPIKDEPHHRLVLQNDFVRVYDVAVLPLDATLLHRHDRPYLGVTLGPADLVNAESGKPEAHLTLQDGQVIYSPGEFAHLVRTDSGLPFHNITVELVRPQGSARNLCKEIIQGPLGACPQQASAGKKYSPEVAGDVVPYFETDEARVDLIKVAGGKDYVEETPKLNSLLVALSNANLDVDLGGQHIAFLHGGDILWLPAAAQRKVVDFLGTKSSFFLISFKDSASSTGP
jgi:hypothetical protein